MSNLQEMLRAVHGHLYVAEATRLHEYASTLISGECVVEFGHYQGRSTIALAMGAQKHGARVYTFDPHVRCDVSDVCSDGTDVMYGKENAPIFLRNIVQWKVEDAVIPVMTTSDHFARFAVTGPIALAFIDGLHTYDQVLEDATILYNRLKARGVIAFHDSDWEGPRLVIEHMITAHGMTLLERVDSTTFLRLDYVEGLEGMDWK